LHGHNDDVSALAISPDGKTLATTGYDYTLRLWDTDTWKPRAVIDDAFDTKVFALVYDPKGTRLAAGGWDEEVTIWDESGQPLESLPTPAAGSLCFSPNGEFIAVGSDVHGIVDVWNVDQKKLVEKYRVGHGSASVAFLTNGELLIGAEGQLKRRHVASFAESTAHQKSDIRTESVSIDISATGELMVAGYGRYEADPGEGAIACWDLRNGKHRLLPGHDGSSVFGVATDSTGNLIVAGGGPRHGPGFVKFWDPRTRMMTRELPNEEVCVSGVALSPAGDRLAVVSVRRVALWENLSSQPSLLWDREASRSVRVAFSPRGDVLAVGFFGGDGTEKSPPTVMLWDAANGAALESVSFDRAIKELAFSPDGRLLVSIDYGGKVEVYDRHEKRTVLREHAHEEVGMSVAISPDGRTLATASSNPQIKFWHLPTMMHVATVKTSARVAKLAFFRDGQTLAVGYMDRNVELWHVDREKEQFNIDGAEE
jgi:WD40 repeat protein